MSEGVYRWARIDGLGSVGRDLLGVGDNCLSLQCLYVSCEEEEVMAEAEMA